MTVKRIISIICLTALLVDIQPISAIANTIQSVEATQLENSKHEENSTNEEVKNEEVKSEEKIDKKENDEKKQDNEKNKAEESSELIEKSSDEAVSQEVSDSPLKDVSFNFLSDKKSKPYLQVGFDISNSTYTSKIDKELLNKIKDSKIVNDTKKEIINLLIFDVKGKEKLSLKLSIDDLLKDNALEKLEALTYEIGDKISVKALQEDVCLVSVDGVTGGDISLEQEDYSDGIDNLDYLHNVRFIVESTGIKTLYNKAPVIEGATDTEVSSFDDFKPLEGITVSDDHDKNLIKDLSVETKDLKENQKQFIYRVTDKWGRSTEAIRTVTLIEAISNFTNTPATTLANNPIAVKGIRFGTNSQYGDTETRFNITFNDRSRKIYVTNQDGRSMNSSVKGTYFRMTLYDAEGNKKKEVEINGDERSNTTKLDELRFYGWSYQYGDYISLWHHEAPLKISISGNVQQNPGENAINFSTELTKNLLETTRFKLTSTGLSHTLNKPPVITFPEGEEAKVIRRGEEIDLMAGVTVEDDFGVVSAETSGFDSTKLGKQTVSYTATDTWGVSTIKDRVIIVVPKNKIEEALIKVKSINGTHMFSLGFDEIKRQFIVDTGDTDAQINPSNNSTELTITVFNKFNVKKREFKISGKDTVKSTSIQKLINYRYEEGDYVQVTPSNLSLVTIDGDIENLPSEIDYTTGVNDLDKWINVRFQLSDGNFKYIYNEAPAITGNEDITIARGDQFDVLSGMKVSDDKDGEVDLTKSNTTVTLRSGKDIFLGEQVYEIKYTDSWGRTSSVERTVVIKPAKPVEEYQIKLFDGDKTILSFSYDSIDKKFKVLSYDKEYSFVNSDEENAFVLEFYDYATHTKQEGVVLKSEDLIDERFLQNLTGVVVQEGWYIKLWAYDFNKLRITSSNKAITDINFANDDAMENTRFEISDSEITSIYNKAPIIEGIEDVSIVYGTTFEKMQGVSVEDEESGLQVTVHGDVNTNQLGPQVLTYEVTDSFGRTTTRNRTVTVVPVYTVNEVKYHNDNGDEIFSIGINKSATGFTVSLPKIMPVGNRTSSFEFNVFNANEEKIYELKIEPTTEINEELFKGLKALIIRPEYLFSVNSTDLTKLKINGRLEKDSQVESTNYNNLTAENKDAVDNVRFKLTENIIKVIYNEAPVINIAEDKKNIIRNQAIVLEEYDLLEGLTISDDKDKLAVDKIEIELPEDEDILTKELDKAKDLIGETVTITYQVEDSWGRFSEKVTRELTIESAMDDMEARLLYAGSGLIPNSNELSLTIGFDIVNGRLNLKNGNMSLFKYSNAVQYGSFAVLDKDDNVKIAVILGGINTYDRDDPIFLNTRLISNNVQSIINVINQKQTELESRNEKLIEYGDKLIFKTYQSPFLYIDGKIIDNEEDYSQGAKINGILERSQFQVTPAGLKQIYEGPTINEGEFSQLTIYNIVAGSQSVNMYLDNTDSNNLVLRAVSLDNEWIDTLNYGDVFRIEIRNADGTFLKGANHLGRTRPAALAKAYDGTVVERGGYLTLKWESPINVKNSKLYNIERQEKFPAPVDYSGDITEETYFNDVRFYFESDGIVPTYNSAPTFTGIEDKSISLGEEFNPRDGVTVSDDHDRNISTYEVTGTVDINRVGEYTLTYSARDSWGRVGTYERKVHVKPLIHENHFEVYTKDNEKSFSIDFEPNLSDGASNGQFKVTKFSDEPLDIDRATDKVFEVWVYGQDGSIKKNITLLGRDTSDSEKLNDLNELNYDQGDFIKVWRAPDFNADNASIEEIKVIGNLGGNLFDFEDPEKGIEYMNNTLFYINPTGLEAYYNKAPVLHGVKDIVIYYGEHDYNLLDGVNATDDRDNSLNVRVNPQTIITDRLGTTEVTYSVTDSWGRTTSQTANVTVRSKSYLNRFEIYGGASGSEELKFSIGFNSNVNSFEFYNSDEKVSLDTIDLSTIPNDLNITVFSRFGRVKLNIQLLETDSIEQKREKLNELKTIAIENFDMIQISTSKHSKVKLKGDVVDSTSNYQDGFNSEEEMRAVRFQVKNEGLTEVRRTESDDGTFEGLTKLTIKRGEEVNLFENILVDHPNEIIQNITVSGFDKLAVGTQTVTYSATDSWGTTFTATRVVEVLPFNDLERVRITVSDADTTELIKLKFDAIESTLSYELNTTSSLLSKLRRVLLFDRTLPNETVVLTASTFNKDMMEMGSISITKGDIVDNNSSKLDEINDVSFVEGGFIGIDIYDFSVNNALSMSGPVAYLYIDKNTNQDMMHIRYYISEEGLKACYNEAPKVTAKDVEHRIATDFDLNKALTISDDQEESAPMEVEFSEYDPYAVGHYDVTATVTDSWGLAIEVPFKVYVLSHLDDNTITLKSDTNKDIATLGFNSKSGKLSMRFYEENFGVPILSSSSADTIIKLNIYDDKQEKTVTIPFNGNDTGATIEAKLTAAGFVDYSYHYNYFIGLEVTENAKSLVKIANVQKEDDHLDSVDYENGVTDVDYFNNVRFKLDPYGLAAIYNKAPVLTNEVGDITAVKSLNVDDYNLLNGIYIADDKDKLRLENVDIKYNNSSDPSTLIVGENDITLTIKDTWGRESEPISFKLNLTSAMDNLDITFLHAARGLVPDFNNKAAVLTFDMEQGKILVNHPEENTAFKYDAIIQYGVFAVYDENDRRVFGAILGGGNTFDTEGEFSDLRERYRYVSKFKEHLENVNIKYGYKIKIKIYQSPFVYINGSVINAQEDYSEGAYLSEILHDSTFTITEEGLVQNYDKVESQPNNNDIVWLSGVAGSKLFTININPETKRLTATQHNQEPLDTLYTDNSPLFSIKIYDANGDYSYGVEAKTRNTANAIVTALNNQSFEIGGYMTIKIHPTDRNRMRNMKIYGDITKTSNLEHVDYAGEIKDVAYFNESRFYFTENGLSLKYNDAPAFTGLTDVVLLRGQVEEVDLEDNVTVYDDNTENIDYRIEDANRNLINNPNSYRPPSLGAHEVYYVAEDSMGRITREPRFIWLQSASEIRVTDESLLTVQEANPALQTEDEILEYLINLVRVYDEEDDLAGKPIKITEENIDGTFYPNIPGTYPITYTVQDSDGNVSEATFDINVVRTISVSVPTYIPFQVITNLIENPDNPTSSPDPFVSGVMKVTNNYVTDVDVSLKEFSKVSETGDLEIVKPNRFSDWSNLTDEETMRYMALGIYNKSNFEDSLYTEEAPLWLENNSANEYIGILPKATSLSTPNEGKLSFVSKHGTNFIGGTTKGKFNLIFEFR